MKKRAFAVLTIVALVSVLVAGCATPAPAPEPTTPPPAEATATTAPPPAEGTATSAPATPPAGPATTYKIGFFSSITGAAANVGVPERNTAEMVAAQLAEAGGVTGPDGVVHPVEIILYDDESNPEISAAMATKLIEEDQVDAIVGGSGPDQSVAVVPLAQEAGIPYISMDPARPIIIDPVTRLPYYWTFSTAPENGHAGLVQGLYGELTGVIEACELYSNDANGKDSLAVTTGALLQKGILVTYSAAFEPTDTTFPQMADVVASGCNALFIGAVPPAAALVTVAARQAAPDLPIILGQGVCNAEFLSEAGAAAEGTVFTCGKLLVADQLLDTDASKELLAKYIADYTEFTGGEPLNEFGGFTYDALRMVMEAMGSLESGLDLPARRAAIRDYIGNDITNWAGTAGSFYITRHDHVGLAYTDLFWVRVENGAFKLFPTPEWGMPYVARGH